ncbi:MAG: thioredoxin family protein [Myxococcales bacterium]|nr:thioredoxin family protein [Myxococcales bacterium]
MPAIELTDADFADRIAASSMAIVDFHAGWCGPCILFKPKFKRISDSYPHVTFFMVDGEASPQARSTVQIDNLPYFAVYRDGVFVEGVSTAEEAPFRAFVEKHFGSGA